MTENVFLNIEYLSVRPSVCLHGLYGNICVAADFMWQKKIIVALQMTNKS